MRSGPRLARTLSARRQYLASGGHSARTRTGAPAHVIELLRAQDNGGLKLAEVA